MDIPELFFRLIRLEMDVLDVLAMRTMDRDRRRLNRIRLAILQRVINSCTEITKPVFVHLARE
jgi:hypothetical protein